jgi:hypothetical protein
MTQAVTEPIGQSAPAIEAAIGEPGALARPIRNGARPQAVEHHRRKVRFVATVSIRERRAEIEDRPFPPKPSSLTCAFVSRATRYQCQADRNWNETPRRPHARDALPRLRAADHLVFRLAQASTLYELHLVRNVDRDRSGGIAGGTQEGRKSAWQAGQGSGEAIRATDPLSGRKLDSRAGSGWDSMVGPSSRQYWFSAAEAYPNHAISCVVRRTSPLPDPKPTFLLEHLWLSRRELPSL